MSFTIMTESDKKFEYPLTTWTFVDSDDNTCKVNDPEITINGIAMTRLSSRSIRSGNCIKTTTTVPLKGAKQYSIRYSRIKRYNINQDYFIGLKSAFIINNLTVELELPDGIEATFVPRGTIEEFEEVKKI